MYSMWGIMRHRGSKLMTNQLRKEQCCQRVSGRWRTRTNPIDKMEHRRQGISIYSWSENMWFVLCGKNIPCKRDIATRTIMNLSSHSRHHTLFLDSLHEKLVGNWCKGALLLLNDSASSTWRTINILLEPTAVIFPDNTNVLLIGNHFWQKFSGSVGGHFQFDVWPHKMVLS